MFRKINQRTLIYLFGALLVLAVISQLWERKKGDRTFRSELASFDTSRVTGITITDLKSGKKPLELIRSGHTWQMKSGDREYRTDKDNIINLLGNLTGMKAERIVATGKEKWKEYEVTDSLALRVTARNNRKTIADLMVGRFSWQPSNNPYDRQGIMTTYVRPADEANIYAVQGFVRMNISPDADRYRDKIIARVRPEGLSKLTFRYPADSSFVLEKQGDAWTIQGQPADSAKTASYLSALENLSGDALADEAGIPGQAVFSLSLESGSAPPVEISAYVADSVDKYIITSTLNPDTQFSSRNGLADRIFKNKKAFFTGPPAMKE